jgi:hypothetical protein
MSIKGQLAESYPTGESVTQPTKRRKWYYLFGKDVSHVPVDEGYSTGSDTASLHTDTMSNYHNVFAPPEAVDIYKIVDGFEGAHRFEPSATWESQEEEKLVRRVCSLCDKFSLNSDNNAGSSLIGLSHFRPVSCSLLSSWTVATLSRLFQMAC